MISVPLDLFFVFLLVFLRAVLILSFFPLFGEGFVPVRIRVLLSGVIAIALTPVAPFGAELFPRSPGALALLAGSEAILALAIGLIGRGLFGVIQLAGQLGGEQMGFGIVNTIDPSSSAQISVVAEMQYLLAILVFLTAGMHHSVLAAIAGSFSLLPPGSAAMTGDLGAFFLRFGSAIFSLAVQFAMPVILIVFVINIAMAMIGRAAPQLNVFIESFPIRIIGGMLVLIAGLGLMVRLWLRMFEGMDGMFLDVIGRMKA